LFDYALRDPDDTVGVEGIHRHARTAALIAPLRERLEQTVVKRVQALFPVLNCRLLTVHEAGDLLCEQLIPKFPTQSGSKLFGDLSRSRAVFPLDCDDSDHDLSKCLDAAADEVAASRFPYIAS